ncbi:MAG: hypothetical protein HYV63_06675 [Candidatus Schekmanbacteria bacterium]|nr:hypothetical protein [Candidatus Schekmanbacteria bacterium]
MSKVTVAVDVGPAEIRWAVARRGRRYLEGVRRGTIPFATAAPSPAEALSALPAAVAGVIGRRDEIAGIAMLVSAARCGVRHVTLPASKPEILARLVENELTGQLAPDLEPACFAAVRGRKVGSGALRDVIAWAAPAAAVVTPPQALADKNTGRTAHIPDVLAARQAVATWDPPASARWGVIDVGAAHVAWMLCEQDTPLLARALPLPCPLAEALLERSPEGGVAALSAFEEQLRLSMDAAAGGVSRRGLWELVLTGSGAAGTGLAAWLHRRLDMPVRSFEMRKGPAIPPAEAPGCAAVLGACLVPDGWFAASAAPAIRRQASLRGLGIVAALFLAATISVAGRFAAEQGQYDRLQREITALARPFLGAGAAGGELRRLRAMRDEITGGSATASTAARKDVLSVVSAVTRAFAKSPKVRLDELEIQAGGIVLSGWSPSYADVDGLLDEAKRHPELGAPQLENADTNPRDGSVVFRVRLKDGGGQGP